MNRLSDMTKNNVHLKKIFFAFLIFILFSCSPTTNEVASKVVERNGVLYPINSEIPFEGRVIDYHIIKNELGEKNISLSSYYKNGIKNGLEEYFHESGQLFTSTNYKNGLKDGPFKSYYENGQLYLQGYYVNDNEDGLFEYYTDDGIAEISSSFRQGLQHGLTISYYQDGSVKSSTTYKNGKNDGLAEEFHKNGQKKRSLTFKNGLKDGLERYFTADGQPEKTIHWQNGTMIKYFLYYVKNNQLISEEIMTTLLTISTSAGEIKIQLDPENAPITTKNFINLAKDGYYTGTIFHRIIDGFMVQGGGLDENMTPKPTNTDPIQNEANNGLKNNRGSIAMARTMDPHSATGQFFINHKDNDFLNHTAETSQGWGYAVFGSVIDGMDVVDQIALSTTSTVGGYADAPLEPTVINSVTVSE